MKIVNMHEAKTHLSRLVEAASNGESFIIAKSGKPVARVCAIDAPETSAKRRTGFLLGQFCIPDDFDRMGEGSISELFGQ